MTNTALAERQEMGELAKALAAAQAEMPNAPMNKTNPHFKSKYADLAAIREATLPSLTKNGLAIYQRTQLLGNDIVLVTTLAHSSGQSIESQYPIPYSDKPQIMGSALTYARRYSWAALCGVAAEEDDDANAAQTATNGRKAPGRRQGGWGASAAAKEGKDWEQLQRELEECETTVMWAKLFKEYQTSVFPTWSQAWVDQGIEAFEKRREVLQGAPDLKAQLVGSIAKTRAEYIQECHDRVSNSDDASALLAWWNDDETKAERRRFSLTKDEVEGLKERVLERRAALEPIAAG